MGPALVAWADPVSSAPLHVARVSREDLRRSVGFGAERRRAFLLGRSLVVDLVERLFPDAAGWSVGTSVCPRCGSHHGGVEIGGAPVVASVSHARGLVIAAAACTSEVVGLGVDAEEKVIDPARDGELERLLGPDRPPMLRRWTRVEAVLKADGRGLSVDPGTVRLHGGEARIADDPNRYQLADVAGPAGYVISLAWLAAGASGAGADPATG